MRILCSVAEKVSAQVYRKAVDTFAADVENVRMKLNAMLQHGNKAAMSALMDTEDGQLSWKRLVGALDSADMLLRKQNRVAGSLLVDVEKHNTNRGGGHVPLLSDLEKDDEKFDAVLTSATESLHSSRANVLDLFDGFCTLSEIHSRTHRDLPPIPPPSPNSHRGTSNARLRSCRSIQSSFYDRPFHVVVDESLALEIAEELGVVSSDKTHADCYTLTMREMAERWVEDSLDEITVDSLGRAQNEVVRNLQLVFDAEMAMLRLAGVDIPSSETLRYAHIADLEASARKAVMRETSQKFSIAFCGMVKAGKSLFLNALMGSMILPSDELPSTAWPCRVRHVRGQLTPSLEIDAAYFQRAINSLQHKKYGAMMQNYRPVADIDLFSALLDDDVFLEDDQHIEEDLHLINEKRELYQRWIDLHPTTKNNLLRFERSGYRIAEWASGHDHVVDLLAQVNDIIRLCRRLKVPLPTCRNIQYPLLKIEFEALRDEQFEGVFEFIDLPGVGESDDSFHSFEDLVRGVAKEVDAVVPVVSFKEVSKDDWRQQLPDIIKAGLGHPPEVVLCTHLDQVAKDRVEEQMASVAKAFWPRKLDAQHRILGCSSRMGFSARSLLRHSRSAKPQFNEIWCEDAIEYDCAEKILGTHEPESTFHNLSFEVWNKAVSDQLTRSGLQSTIKRLVTEMVISSHQRALVEEGSRIAKQIRKAISNQHRLLLSMHRSTEAREQAYRTFEKARSDYQGVLAEWALTAADLQMTSSRKLKAGFQLLEREGTTVAYQAIENTEKANRTTLSAQRAEINDLGELVFQDVHAAEMFLQQVQVHMNKSLSYLKRKFVDFVRTLANRSRADHFASLKKRIQGFGTDDLHSILQGEIIEELTDRGSGMEALAFSTVRRKVMHTVATKHSAASAYRALQETIAKPLLKQKAIGAFQDTLSDSSSGSMDTSESFSRVEDLGFMLRAPIAVIAAVPWLFGSAIWPFMKNTEKFILNKDAFVTELKEHIIYPFFEALKQEGQNTLEQMMARSSEAARGAVRDALAMEEQQFESEQAVGNQSSSQTIGTALNTLLNLIAAEAALIKLQGLLKDIPSP